MIALALFRMVWLGALLLGIVAGIQYLADGATPNLSEALRVLPAVVVAAFGAGLVSAFRDY